MNRKPFAIESSTPPRPLTLEEVAEKYGLSPDEIARGREFVKQFRVPRVAGKSSRSRSHLKVVPRSK
jgi:hypothetical protein